MSRPLPAVVSGLVVGLSVACPPPGRAVPPAPAPPAPAGVTAALDYLAAEHDRFHTKYVVHDDRWSGAGLFAPSLRMGALEGLPPAEAQAVLDDACPTDPAEGLTCIRVALPKDQPAGWTKDWLAFALTTRAGPDGRPVGYDLRPYLAPGEEPRLVFMARGAKGGELVEFKVHAAESHPAPPIHTLTRSWARIELPVPPGYLDKAVSELFCCAASRAYNPGGATFFVDDVRLEFGPRGTAARLAEPRFIRSYVGATAGPPDEHFRSVAYCYDQALAVSALVARGRPDDLRRAKLIADTFVLLQDHDRGGAGDGRVRNVGCPGDPIEPTFGPARRAARVPGRWDTKDQAWREDEYFVGSDCGNTAWVVCGLLNYWEAAGRPAASPHLAAAARMGRWVDRAAFAADGPGGFTGGLLGFDGPGQRKAGWRSTEHALDLYCAFRRLADATGDARFRACADHARRFVEAMWNPAAGHLWTGTKDDGVTVNTKPVPVDVQAWSVLAMRDAARYGPAVDWAVRHCRVAEPGTGRLLGYDFDADDGDGAWFEGTAQMALAFRFLGRSAEANECLAAVRTHGAAPAPAGAVLAASRDGLTTGFTHAWGPWTYYRRPHVGATAWFVLASLGYNPYWGGPVAAAR